VLESKETDQWSSPLYRKTFLDAALELHSPFLLEKLKGCIGIAQEALGYVSKNGFG
jgi:hypothetical protein